MEANTPNRMENHRKKSKQKAYTQNYDSLLYCSEVTFPVDKRY